MKQSKIMEAYNTVKEMHDRTDLPMQVLWALFQVDNLLTPFYDFEIEQEQKIIDKYHPVKTDAGFTFESAEQRVAFEKEFSELQNMEKDFEDFSKPHVQIYQGLTLKQMHGLKDFIEFTE